MNVLLTKLKAFKHASFRKTIVALAVGLALPIVKCPSAAGAEEKGSDSKPQAFPRERYEQLLGRCPFAVSKEAKPEVLPQGSFATNWYIAGIGRFGELDFVTVKSRDATVQFSLFGTEQNSSNGVILQTVHWSGSVGKSTVTLRKGGEVATLQFDEAQMRETPAERAPQTLAAVIDIDAANKPQTVARNPPASARAKMISR
jgi:hypothetical protein